MCCHTFSREWNKKEPHIVSTNPSIEVLRNAIFTVLYSVTRLYVKTLLQSTVKKLNS